MRLVRVTGKCPYCDVRKNQIDSTEERAMQVVSDALDAHVLEAHPEKGADRG